MTKEYDYLIVGAGLFGATFAWMAPVIRRAFEVMKALRELRTIPLLRNINLSITTRIKSRFISKFAGK